MFPWIAKVFLGLASIWWSVSVLPIAWKEANAIRAAHRTILGDRLSHEAIASLLTAVESIAEDDFCRFEASRASIILRVRALEDAIETSQRDTFDATLSALKADLRRGLKCAPTDAYAWFMLYWASVAQDGFKADYVPYLRSSYQWGPNEGWISVKRNGFALAVLNQLPADVQEMVIGETVSLLDSGFVVEVAANVSGPGWEHRSRILPRLASVKQRFREILMRNLRKDGIEVNIPGVLPIASRPWN